MPDDVIIQLDRKTRAIRSGSRWAVQQMNRAGAYDMVDAWEGGRRTLLQWCERHNVHPTRDAEAHLDALTEGLTFRERT